MSKPKRTTAAVAPAIETKGAAGNAGNETAPTRTREQKIAFLALGAVSSNAITAMTYAKHQAGAIDAGAAFSALVGSVKGVRGGDMCEPGDFLMAQAVALNSMFNMLAMRAHAQQYKDDLDVLMRLALKAQNQCRMTLETLATIKNPPVVIARQANISNGPQQVNNSAAPGPAMRAGKTESVQSELLEVSHGQRLDTRATRSASSADPHLETVGAVHRASQR